MGWFFVFIIIICLGGYFVFKSAEVHELHKVRAAFENKKFDINVYIQDHEEDKEFNLEYYKGEIESLDELESDIDKEIDLLSIYDLHKFGID